MTTYLSEAAAWPLLTREQELTATPDELVKHNLRLVVKVAMKYRRHADSLPDIVQDGNIGLINASRLFDPALGKFSVFAWKHIESTINEGLIVMSRLVRTPREARKKTAGIHALAARGSSNKEIAAALNLTVSSIDAVLLYSRVPVFDDTLVLDEVSHDTRDFLKLASALSPKQQEAVYGAIEGFTMVEMGRATGTTHQNASLLYKLAVDNMRVRL